MHDAAARAASQSTTHGHAVQVSPVPTSGRLRFPLSQSELVRRALGRRWRKTAPSRLTTIATVVSSRHARAKLVRARAARSLVCRWRAECFRQLDPKISIRIDAEDGQAVERGATVLFLTGHARGLLSAERTALNFMQRLSGIASLTARYVDAVKGTKAKILDTRKTTPGWRSLEKYAVRAGGGTNHRMDLADQVLIKDNHLRAVDGDVRLAIRRTRELEPNAKVEVEGDTIEQSRPRSMPRPTSSCWTTWRRSSCARVSTWWRGVGSSKRQAA